ncbi:unnamed protein product [Dovyalis caffra]|uniref:Uncharacterized protein n=1 Tax=Dovyalis caffra TaxID=77055 RepID=A0AAV1R0E7_9ROSI|nr:unnamed protein product [Dovyalis caffra]
MQASHAASIARTMPSMSCKKQQYVCSQMFHPMLNPLVPLKKGSLLFKSDGYSDHNLSRLVELTSGNTDEDFLNA